MLVISYIDQSIKYLEDHVGSVRSKFQIHKSDIKTTKERYGNVEYIRMYPEWGHIRDDAKKIAKNNLQFIWKVAFHESVLL